MGVIDAILAFILIIIILVIVVVGFVFVYPLLKLKSLFGAGSLFGKDSIPTKIRESIPNCKKEFGTDAFYNLRTNSCWKCPPGYKRAVFRNIEGAKACRKGGLFRASFKPAIRLN